MRIPATSVESVDAAVGAALRYHGGFLPLVDPRHEHVLGCSQDGAVRIAYWYGADREVREVPVLNSEGSRLAEGFRAAGPYRVER